MDWLWPCVLTFVGLSTLFHTQQRMEFAGSTLLGPWLRTAGIKQPHQEQRQHTWSGSCLPLTAVTRQTVHWRSGYVCPSLVLGRHQQLVSPARRPTYRPTPAAVTFHALAAGLRQPRFRAQTLAFLETPTAGTASSSGTLF